MRIARITTQPVVVLSVGTRRATASSQLLDAKYFALHARRLTHDGDGLSETALTLGCGGKGG